MVLKLFLFVLIIINISVNRCSSISPSDLPTLINGILNNCSNTDCLGVEWGIVVDLYDPFSSNQPPQNIYSLNENLLFTPASCTKLFTTSTIFYTFGEQFVIETPFYTKELFTSGIDLDHICVKGLGDPSLSIDQLSNAAKFFSMANSIDKVILDLTFYTDQYENVPQAWEIEDLNSGYGAIPTPFIINENTFNINLTPSDQVGESPSISFDNLGEFEYVFNLINNAITGPYDSNNTINLYYKLSNGKLVIEGNLPQSSSTSTFQMPILDIESYFFSVFGAMLKSNGITARQFKSGVCNTTENRSFVTISPMLSSMLNYTLLVSDNLYAESFLRLLGTNNYNEYPINYPTFQKGLDTVLSISGISPKYYSQVDGSGLSRTNYISPSAFLQLVESIYFNGGDPNHDFLSYLPVAGVSGTLAYRFINTPAQGIVHAKTGSMTGVNSLSGLIVHGDLTQPQHNQPIIFFSIIQNNYQPLSDINLVSIIDQIVILLSQLSLSSSTLQ